MARSRRPPIQARLAVLWVAPCSAAWAPPTASAAAPPPPTSTGCWARLVGGGCRPTRPRRPARCACRPLVAAQAEMPTRWRGSLTREARRRRRPWRRTPGLRPSCCDSREVGVSCFISSWSSAFRVRCCCWLFCTLDWMLDLTFVVLCDLCTMASGFRAWRSGVYQICTIDIGFIVMMCVRNWFGIYIPFQYFIHTVSVTCDVATHLRTHTGSPITGHTRLLTHDVTPQLV